MESKTTSKYAIIWQCEDGPIETEKDDDYNIITFLTIEKAKKHIKKSEGPYDTKVWFIDLNNPDLFLKGDE